MNIFHRSAETWTPRLTQNVIIIIMFDLSGICGRSDLIGWRDGKTGGGMAPTDTGAWAHIACADKVRENNVYSD
jgi:hypothetical protein